jgi:hypothetical protein
MTDATRPNPLGLPTEPDPTLPSEAPDAVPEVDGPRDVIDDPVAWPVGERDAPDDTRGRSLDLPDEDPDAVQAAPRLAEAGAG